METVKLSDGTELEGRVLESGDGSCIYVYLTNVTMMQGFLSFSDERLTYQITFTSYETEHVYTGYTRLFSISGEFNNCNIVMRKGAANAT